ncbi:TetR/AcrR family transcriptional regulator [Ideonella sp. A 288]|uniref:TetR/AcrR family transcriptional regulator n=1 Tax=Ideonella sp. A 288 TaxID=1962181 RepID=UPI000B4A931A|nr:TetR/AcrR family transcriptional regulator [Ideonella sp. A 288]
MARPATLRRPRADAAPAAPADAAPAAPAEATAAAAAAPRALRQRAVADAKRQLVLAAAREAFLELGLERASLREIARRAGYTPGAIYSYFASKEEMYAALLGESLERLNAAVAAPAAGDDAATELRARAIAFFDFYRQHPRDLDLGFYLFDGMQPRGLTPALNDALNARLRDALTPSRQALQALGLGVAAAQAETTALFAQIVGLLVLSHTGRIRMFRQSAQVLFARHLDALIVRCESMSTSTHAAVARTTRARPRRPQETPR